MKLIIFLSLLQILSGNPAAFLRDSGQLKTLQTLTPVGDSSVFTLDYKADYHLQDFLDASLNSQAAVKAFAAAKLLNVPSPAPKGESFNPACSAFQAVTPEGDVIYGRNFDYRFEDGGTIMMRTRPRGGYKSLSMVSMGFLGMNSAQYTDGRTDLSMLLAAPLMQMDGMNEKGLAVSVLVVMYDDCAKQLDSTKKDIMTSVMMRMFLDRAATVDEALEMLRGYNFWSDGYQTGRKKGNFSNYHFLLSDAGGKTVVLECVQQDGPGSGSPWIISTVDEKMATNHFRTPAWRNVGRQDERFSHMEEALAQKGGVLTEQEAMRLLDEVHQEASDGHEGRTQWSVVYNLTKGTAKLCLNHQYDKMYEFSLRGFGRKKK